MADGNDTAPKGPKGLQHPPDRIKRIIVLVVGLLVLQLLISFFFDILPEESVEDLAGWSALWIGAPLLPLVKLVDMLRRRRAARGKPALARPASAPPFWFRLLAGGLLYVVGFGFIGAGLVFGELRFAAGALVVVTAHEPLGYEVGLDEVKRPRREPCNILAFRIPSHPRQEHLRRCFGSWSTGDRVRIKALRGPYGTRILSLEKAS